MCTYTARVAQNVCMPQKEIRRVKKILLSTCRGHYYLQLLDAPMVDYWCFVLVSVLAKTVASHALFQELGRKCLPTRPHTLS